MRRFSKNRIAISVLLAVFTATGNVYPQQATTPMGEPVAETSQGVGLNPPAGQAEVSSSQVLRETLNPYLLNIPDKFGKIEEVFQGSPGSPVIVHIQDAHANYEAQLNIKRILSHLSETYKVNLVQLEGASSKLNPSVFEAAYLKEANLKMADYLMREGRLSGAEAFAIESEEPVELHGIENRMLYMENLRTFRAVYSHQNEINEYFRAIRVLAKDLRTKLLNEELLDLTRNMEAYAQEKIDLLDYLLYLNGLAEKYKIASLKNLAEINRFPNLVRILRLHELEQRLDEKILKKESGALKKAFQEKTSSPEAQELLASLDLKKKGMKPRAYFRKLTSLADQQAVDLLAYPQIRTMAEFLILQDEIEHHGLFSEVHRLEKIMQKRLFKKREERQLTGLLKSIDLLEQYFKLEVNREKLAYIMKHHAKTKSSYIKSQLDQLARDFGVPPSDYSGNTQNVDRFMDDVEYFYRVVLERDRLFVENVLTKIKGAATDRTVLITGGFHTDGLTTLFRKQDVSYLVIIPKVDVKQGNEKYVKVMMDKDSEVGSVFAGTFALAHALESASADQFPDLWNLVNGYLKTATGEAAEAARITIANTQRTPPLATVEAALSRFHDSQPLIRVVPLGEGVFDEKKGSFTYQLRIYYRDERNVVMGATYESTSNGERFETRLVADWKQARTNEMRDLNQKGYRLDDLIPVSAVQSEVGARFEGPSLLGQAVTLAPTSEKAVQAQVPPAETVLKESVVLHSVLSPQRGGEWILRRFPGLRRLAQGSPLAIKALERAVARGRQITTDLINRVRARYEVGPEITGDVIMRAVSDQERANRLGAFVDYLGSLGPRIVFIASMQATGARVRLAEIVSAIEEARRNVKSAFVVYGPGVKELASAASLGVPDDVLKRVKFVDVPDDAATVLAIEDAIRSGRAYNLFRKLTGIPVTHRAFEEGRLTRVMVPQEEAKFSDRLSTRWPNVVQILSILREPAVRKDLDLSNIVAVMQVKAAGLLPTLEEKDSFLKLVRDLDLEDVFVDLGNNRWRLNSLSAKLQEIIVDYLVAREIAIRA